MGNIREINERIAKNLIHYRKATGLTQAELAEKINYSDKSISKWESAGGVPDVYVLLQLAKLYGVSIDDLVGTGTPVQPKNGTERKKKQRSHLFIMLLSSGIVWLVATCVFVGLLLWNEAIAAWLSFLYAVVANSIVLIIYSGIWKYRLLNFISVSTLIWTTIVTICLTVQQVLTPLGVPYGAIWNLFLLGIPLQVLETLWIFFRSLFKRGAKKEKDKIDENIE